LHSASGNHGNHGQGRKQAAGLSHPDWRQIPNALPLHGISPHARLYAGNRRKVPQIDFEDQSVEWPSSLLLVANRIAATKMATITETTKKGEVISIAQAP
jgi:hypothetical protein